MNKTSLNRRASIWAFKLGELLLAWFAFANAAALSGTNPWTPSLLWHEASTAPVFAVFVVASWHLVLLTRGLYASHRLEEPYREALDLFGCVVIATGIAVIGTLFWQTRLATAAFAASYWATLTLFVIVERGALRSVLRHIRVQGRNLRFALIVGAGERARRIARILHTRVDLGYRVIGCVDDIHPVDPVLMPWLGSLDRLSQVLSDTVIDEVFIVLPMRSSYARIQQALMRCEEQGALVTMPTDFFAARLARTRLGEIAHQQLLYLSALPENNWRLVVKRGVDFFGVIVLLLLLSPVLAAVASAVRLTSPGPILFRQVRIGLNKRPFTLYKFRSMVRDAESQQAGLEDRNEVSGPVFKIRRDPRVTSIGSFLRRTSLDELPQLFNVLKGEMSLVGPRPLPVRDVAGFREYWHRRRFSVLPGITCLWQLAGRSDVSFGDWMKLDLQYIDEWSLGLDLGILVKTAGKVIQGKGAY